MFSGPTLRLTLTLRDEFASMNLNGWIQIINIFKILQYSLLSVKLTIFRQSLKMWKKHLKSRYNEENPDEDINMTEDENSVQIPTER